MRRTVTGDAPRGGRWAPFLPDRQRQIGPGGAGAWPPPDGAGALSRLLALVERERLTRFSGGRLAPLWAFLTPMAWITLVVLAFGWLGRTVPIAAPMPVFVATGILPYATFRQVIGSAMRTVIANRFLLHLGPVTRGELLLASALLELFNALVLAAAIFLGLWLFARAPLPEDLFAVLAGLGLAWFLGAAAGRLAAVLGQMSDAAARAIPLVLRPMFWISGVFFTATELAAGVQGMLWWNPLFHATEILREGFFLGHASPVSSAWYPLAVASVLHLVSILLERQAAAGPPAGHQP